MVVEVSCSRKALLETPTAVALMPADEAEIARATSLRVAWSGTSTDVVVAVPRRRPPATVAVTVSVTVAPVRVSC